MSAREKALAAIAARRAAVWGEIPDSFARPAATKALEAAFRYTPADQDALLDLASICLLQLERFERDEEEPGEVLVKLTAEHWRSVLRAMRWPLPPQGDPEHAERCFDAFAVIQTALGEPPSITTLKGTP